MPPVADLPPATLTAIPTVPVASIALDTPRQLAPSLDAGRDPARLAPLGRRPGRRPLGPAG